MGNPKRKPGWRIPNFKRGEFGMGPTVEQEARRRDRMNKRSLSKSAERKMYREMEQADKNNERHLRFQDIQEDLETCLEGLTDIDLQNDRGGFPGDDQADVAGMFSQLVENKIGRTQWESNLVAMRIITLRKIAQMATQYGLAELRAILNAHIQLRLTPNGKRSQT